MTLSIVKNVIVQPTINNATITNFSKDTYIMKEGYQSFYTNEMFLKYCFIIFGLGTIS